MSLRAGRRRIEISKPDKPLFSSGETKLDLATYYERVAGAMLPHLARRPLNLERYPDGADGPRLIQQHADRLAPWVRRVAVPSAKGPVQHVAANDAATLVYLANLACITLHRWLSRGDMLDKPDVLVFDLDPSTDSAAEIRRAARLIGDLLRELGLRPWAMTTGSRGYHVAVALRRRAGFDAVRQFARDVAELAVAREPRLFTAQQRKRDRGGRILIDVMRNGYAQTAVAPYSVRPRPTAPVATPLHWDELQDRRTSARRWTLASVPERLQREGDPWREMPRHAQSLTRAAQQLGEALAEAKPAQSRPGAGAATRPGSQAAKRLTSSA
ncbi:MAG TPA: non-homologous end-joining DNA ligase [Solirubrobacteraceae bacterium]|nr:non-homologous end-joining DNA ligase [Solirubrobacteraceae bacterium]